MICLCLILCFHAAWAQDADADTKKPVSRPCTDADLVGHTYKMVDFSEQPPGQETHWVKLSPYEYIKFMPNNGYSSIGATWEMSTHQELDKFLGISKKIPMKYTLAKDGVLTLLINGKVSYNYRCTAILRHKDRYIPGDLVMNAYSRDNKGQIYRLYRRWN